MSDRRAQKTRQAQVEATSFYDQRLGRLEERIDEFSAGLAEALTECGFSTAFILTTVGGVRDYVQAKVFSDLNRRRGGRSPTDE